MDKKVKYMIALLVFLTLITILVPNAFSKYTETASNTIKINTTRPQYTFKFNANGGTGSMSDLVVKRDVSQNLTANAFERSGYDFIGWNTESNGTGISYTDEQEVAYASLTDGEVITLYAQWFDKSYLNNTTELENYSCTEDVKTFEAPQTGSYILEAWGAQGGSVSENVNGTKTMAAIEGGRGGYSYGIVNLNAGDKIYVVVGCQGNELKNAGKELTEPGGYNGGGLALSDGNKNTQGSGGGATHFAVNQNLGELKNYSNNQNDILLVAGGGGGSYSSADISYYSKGGYGGGLTAGDALIHYDTRYRTVGLIVNGSMYYQGLHVPGAEQTQLSSNSMYYYGSFGSGADAIRNSSGADAGAGGGWYGGNKLSKSYGAGGMAGSGGSGHINTTSITEGATLAGNLQIPTHDGTSYMTGNTGDGYAKISILNSGYTITYDANGGTGSMSVQNLMYNIATILTANSFTKEGYKFNGWNTERDGSGQSYTDQQSITISTQVANDNITLYAQWKTFVWTQNLTQVDNGEVTLEVGSKITGYSANGISDWYVLGAKDGKLLISTNYSPEKVNLSGESGYTNGVSTLNTSAQSYDDGNLAYSVRSINLEDIDRVTGYNPVGSNIGQLNEYLNEVTYSWDGTDKPYYSGSNGVTENLTKSHTSFKYPSGTGFNTSPKSTTATSSSKIDIVTLTCTYSGYKGEDYLSEDSLAFAMLFNNTGVLAGDEGSYWLADTYIYCSSDYAKYGLLHIRSQAVRDYYLVRSNSQLNEFTMGLRPVVAFKSEVEVDENGLIIN